MSCVLGSEIALEKGMGGGGVHGWAWGEQPQVQH